MGTTTPTAQRPAATDATSPAPASKKPVAVFRFENVSAAVFVDREPNRDGGKPLYNISLTRSFQVEGAWKSTHTLWPSDALPAIEALRKAYEFACGSRSDTTPSE